MAYFNHIISSIKLKLKNNDKSQNLRFFARKFGLEPIIAGLIPRAAPAFGWKAGFIAGACDVRPVTKETSDCVSRDYGNALLGTWFCGLVTYGDGIVFSANDSSEYPSSSSWLATSSFISPLSSGLAAVG